MLVVVASWPLHCRWAISRRNVPHGRATCVWAGNKRRRRCAVAIAEYHGQGAGLGQRAFSRRCVHEHLFRGSNVAVVPTHTVSLLFPPVSSSSAGRFIGITPSKEFLRKHRLTQAKRHGSTEASRLINVSLGKMVQYQNDVVQLVRTVGLVRRALLTHRAMAEPSDGQHHNWLHSTT